MDTDDFATGGDDAQAIAASAGTFNASDRILTTHAKIFAVAEKYGIRGLKALAHHYFAQQTNPTPEDLAEEIKVIFTTTPEHVRELRDIVIKYILTQQSPAILEHPSIEAAIQAVDTLAYELLKKSQGAGSYGGIRSQDSCSHICSRCARKMSKPTPVKMLQSGYEID
ncbi:hypothetical protein LTR37_016243 [Vermiconidia calcicola]|uniref:Uncharacterized protein n=1 Tax=Vermiconidia calcicola TaxID=1690605 RepID=A0ACC3MND7_9PEZI|nr:hypothetical protein LTR37_016243 [Vermiconidia calcicola]